MSTLWDETAERFRKVTDRLGMPIDKGIFDTVVALNALGVPTKMSCEGHLNRGLPHPWIDVRLSDPIGHDTPEIAQIQEEIRLMRIRLYESYTPEMKRLQEGEQEVQLGERLKVFSILSQFYKERSVSFDRIIIIDRYGRIQSQGGDYLSLLPEGERALRMKEYQQEMRDFTTFLRSLITQD